MDDSIRRAKDRGIELMAKKKLQAALGQFESVVKRDPNDLVARQKIGEILVRMGRNAESVAQFTMVADAYANAGMFYKAIAICKVILTVDPASVAAQNHLMKLYGVTRKPAPRMTIEQAPVQASAFAPPAAAEPQGATEVTDDDLVVEIDAAAVPPPPPKEEPNSSLPQIPLFSELSDSDFRAVLLGAVDARVFESGETIVTEGAPGESMFAIVEGEVSVRRPGPDGALREVARMRDGEIFGELALMSGGRRLATIVAEGPVITLEFKKAAMDKVLASHQGVRAALDHFFRERLVANLMRASPLFAGLAPSAKAALHKSFTALNFENGATIIAQGATNDGLFMLLRGMCEVVDAGGARYPDLGEGDLFGEISMILNQPATASVKAVGAVTVLKLTKPTFNDVLLGDSTLREGVLAFARERVARTKQLRANQDLRV